MRHAIAFVLVLIAGVALGRLKPEPSAMIEDVTTRTVAPIHQSDWQSCVPEHGTPPPPPVLASLELRTRNRGNA